MVVPNHQFTPFSVLRAMSLLVLLPLLFAHRPINIHPRGSLLRRMPVFYGKRDPSLASPAVVPLSSFSQQPQSHDTRPRFFNRVAEYPPGYSNDGTSSRKTLPRTRLEHFWKALEAQALPFSDTSRPPGFSNGPKKRLVKSRFEEIKKPAEQSKGDVGTAAKPFTAEPINIRALLKGGEREFYMPSFLTARKDRGFVSSPTKGAHLDLGIENGDNFKLNILRREIIKALLEKQLPGLGIVFADHGIWNKKNIDNRNQVMPLSFNEIPEIPEILRSQADTEASKDEIFSLASNLDETEIDDVNNDAFVDEEKRRTRSSEDTSSLRETDW